MTREEVSERVFVFVRDEYGGDFKLAFTKFDEDSDGGLNSDELTKLLVKAKVGNRLSRFLIVRAALKEVDADGDGKITISEFYKATTVADPPIPSSKGAKVGGELGYVGIIPGQWDEFVVHIYGTPAGYVVPEDDIYVSIDETSTVTAGGARMHTTHDLVSWLEEVKADVEVVAYPDSQRYGVCTECHFTTKK